MQILATEQPIILCANLYCHNLIISFGFNDTVLTIQSDEAERVRAPVDRSNRRDICRDAFIPLPYILPFSPSSNHRVHHHPPPANPLNSFATSTLNLNPVPPASTMHYFFYFFCFINPSPTITFSAFSTCIVCAELSERDNF